MEAIEIYKKLFYFHFPYMTVAYILCMVFKNGSWVDFAWPSGFFLMNLYFFFTGTAMTTRKLIICTPYFLAGLRFMYGWWFGRKHYKWEDARWALWRERWRNGEGLFGITSIPINFFFFYHTQSMFNVFIMSLPLITICNNNSKELTYLEIFGLAVWFISFYLENVADFQLRSFKIKNRGNKTVLMDQGLWKYSRHPNYFFEFMLAVAYAIMTFNSITERWQWPIFIILPYAAYWFLVDFTGIPMCEKQSLKNRGETYRQYQEKTNMFFPWFPRELKKSE